MMNWWKASLILDDTQSQVTCESTQRTGQLLQGQQNSIDSQEMSQLTIDSFDESGRSEPILLDVRAKRKVDNDVVGNYKKR